MTTFPNPLRGGRLRKLHANILNFWLIFDIFTRCYRILKNFSRNNFDVCFQKLTNNVFFFQNGDWLLNIESLNKTSFKIYLQFFFTIYCHVTQFLFVIRCRMLQCILYTSGQRNHIHQDNNYELQIII